MPIAYNANGSMEQTPAAGQGGMVYPGAANSVFNMTANGPSFSNADAFMSSAHAGSGSGIPTGVVSVRPNTASNGSIGKYDPSILQNLIKSFTSSSDAARKASMEQYQKLLAGVAGTSNTVNSLLGQLGKTGETRIAQNQSRQLGQTEQDMTSRGLGNTTLRNSAMRGVNSDAEMARQSLAESLAGQKIGAQMQLGQMQGDALLSARNVDPSQQYLQLISQLAAQR
jgi:hypothetical protein